MIVTTADLLWKLVEKEKKVLAAQPDLNHAPMLGDMYEGLAKHVVNRALFEGLNLNVSDGKIRFRDGSLSGQMDVIVAYGEGTQLPYTEHRLYDFDQVIAVFEVKKTLYGTAMADAFLHLRDVKEKSLIPDKRRFPLIRDAWRGLMRRDYPNPAELKQLSSSEEMVRASLVIDAHQPLRFVLGYEGYKSEFELREGLFNFFEKSIPTQKTTAGFGVTSLPDLIICGGACVTKLNGMPYTAPMLPDGFWPVLGSHAHNPFRTMLELLWTRLAYVHEISAEIFGDDLETEVINNLAEAKWNEPGSGWEYRCTHVSAATLAEGSPEVEWAPAFLSKAAFVVVNRLCQGVRELIDAPGLINFLKEEGMTVDQLAAELRQKNLAYVRDREFQLLTDHCACVIVPGPEGFAAGDNRTGRLTRWLDRYMEKTHAQRASASEDLSTGSNSRQDGSEPAS